MKKFSDPLVKGAICFAVNAKKLVLFLIFILPLTLFSQESNECSGSYDSDNKQQGLWQCHYPGGALRSEINYTAGVMDGIKKDYYENGQMRISANYSSGLLNGAVTEYYDNGQLKSEGSFSNNLPVGLHKDYNADGTLLSQNDFGS